MMLGILGSENKMFVSANNSDVFKNQLFLIHVYITFPTAAKFLKDMVYASYFCTFPHSTYHKALQTEDI